MAGIDLREIRFRAHEDGDANESMSLEPTASGTVRVSLAGIKFRVSGVKEDADESETDTQGN